MFPVAFSLCVRCAGGGGMGLWDAAALAQRQTFFLAKPLAETGEACACGTAHASNRARKPITLLTYKQLGTPVMPQNGLVGVFLFDTAAKKQSAKHLQRARLDNRCFGAWLKS